MEILPSDSRPALGRPAPPRTPAPSSVEPVLLLHGTFANNAAEAQPEWWLPGSPFCQDLDARLADVGSAARCWAHLTPASETALRGRGASVFAWSGQNSERARCRGGRALATVLAALETDSRVSRYHVVAHSHGGNVLLRALAAMPAPQKLGAVVYMGTPVLHFAHRGAWDPRWLTVPIEALGVLGALWGFWRWPEQRLLAVAVAVASGAALAAELAVTPVVSARGPRLYGSGQPHAFVFDPADEAIAALRSADAIRRAPGDFIDQFTAPGPDVTAAQPPTPAPDLTIGSQIERTGASILLHELLAQSMNVLVPPLLSTVVPFPGSARIALPDRPMQPEHLAAMRRVSNFLDTLGTGLPAKALLLVPLIAVCAVAYGVLFTAALVSSAVTAVWARLWGWSTRVMTALGRRSLPTLVVRAIFGEDEGRFERLDLLPPGVAAAEVVSGTLRDQARTASARLAGTTGQAVFDAAIRNDPFAIKSRLTVALADASLAHSLYYQSDEIRERLAALIAQPPQPSSPPFPLLPHAWLWSRMSPGAGATPARSGTPVPESSRPGG